MLKNPLHALREHWQLRDQTTENGIRYGRSRRLFVVDGAMATIVLNVAAGTFIAGLVSHLGGSDAVSGIVGSISVLTTPIQIVSAYIFEGLHRRKKTVILTAALSKVTAGLVFFIPFFISRSEIGLPLFLLTYFFFHLMSSFASPGATNWLVDLVPVSMRGKYFAHRESVCMGALAVITLVTGVAVDFVNARFNAAIGFMVFGSVVLVAAILNIAVLAIIDEPPVIKPEKRTSLKSVVTLPFKSGSFIAVLILGALWNFGVMFGMPFMSVYMVSQLELKYTYIVILTLVSLVIRTFLIPHCGKIAERKGFYYLAKWSIGAMALATFMWVFVTGPTAFILLPLIQVVSAVGWSGLNLSLFNIQIMSMPEDIRTSCISVNSAILGIVGFLSTLLGSRLLNALGDYSLELGGLCFNAMQIVFFISGVLLAVCEIYLILIKKRMA